MTIQSRAEVSNCIRLVAKEVEHPKLDDPTSETISKIEQQNVNKIKRAVRNTISSASFKRLDRTKRPEMECIRKQLDKIKDRIVDLQRHQKTKKNFNFEAQGLFDNILQGEQPKAKKNIKNLMQKEKKKEKTKVVDKIKTIIDVIYNVVDTTEIPDDFDSQPESSTTDVIMKTVISKVFGKIGDSVLKILDEKFQEFLDKTCGGSTTLFCSIIASIIGAYMYYKQSSTTTIIVVSAILGLVCYKFGLCGRIFDEICAAWLKISEVITSGKEKITSPASFRFESQAFSDSYEEASLLSDAKTNVVSSKINTAFEKIKDSVQDVSISTTSVETWISSILILLWIPKSNHTMKSWSAFVKDSSMTMRGLETIVPFVLKRVQDLCDMICQLAGYKNFTLFKSSYDEVDQWVAAVKDISFKCKDKKFSAPREYQETITNLQSEALLLFAKYSKIPGSKGIIDLIRMNLNNLESIRRLLTASGCWEAGMRFKPIVACFFGPSQIGKTFQIPLLVHMIFTALGDPQLYKLAKESPDALVYPRNPECKHWEGYMGQPVVLYDEWSMVPDSLITAENAFIELMRLVQDQKLALHMAAVEQKGNTFFNSKLIFATSNHESVKAAVGNAVSCPDAVRNRIDFELHFNIKREYASEDSLIHTNPKLWELDKTKLPPGGDAIFDIHDVFQEYHVNNANTPGKKDSYRRRVNGMFELVEMFVDKYRQNSEKVNATHRNFSAARKLVLDKMGVTEEELLSGERDINFSAQGGTPIDFEKEEEEYEKFWTNPQDSDSSGEVDFDLSDSDGSELSFGNTPFVRANPANWPVRNVRKISSDFFTGCNTYMVEKFWNFILWWMQYLLGVLMLTVTMLTPQVSGCFYGLIMAVSQFKRLPFGFWDKTPTDLSNNQPLANLLSKVRTYGDFKRLQMPKHEPSAEPAILNLLQELSSENDSVEMAYIITFFMERPHWLTGPIQVWTGYEVMANLKNIYDLHNRVEVWRRIDSSALSSIFVFFDRTMVKTFGLIDNKLKTCLLSRYDLWKQYCTIPLVAVMVFMLSFSAVILFYSILVKFLNPVFADVTEPEVKPEGKDTEIVAINCFTSQMLDTGFEDATKTAWRKNLYAMIYMDSTIGYLLVLKDRTTVFPQHYVQSFSKWCQIDKYDDKVTLRNLAGHEFVVSIFHMAGAEHVHEDIAMLEIPSLHLHKDITGTIVSERTLVQKKKGECVHIRPKSSKVGEDNITLMSTHKYCVMENQVHKSINGEAHTLAAGIVFMGHTTKGDCGTLLFLKDPSSRNVRLMGFHVAGDEKCGASMVQPLFHVLPKFRSQVLDFPDNMTKLGKISRSLGNAGKSQILKSPLYEAWGEAKKMPAKLHPFENSEGKRIDPFQIGLTKYAQNIKPIPKIMLSTILDHTVSDMISAFASDDLPLTAMTFDEAVYGVPGEPFFDSIKRSSSAGFPFNMNPRPGFKGKERFHGQEADLNCDGPDFPELKRQYEEAVTAMLRGERPELYYTASLKDELRPINKAKAGSTRMFQASSYVLTLLIKVYFGKLQIKYYRSHLKHPGACGMNPYSLEWDIMVRMLQKFGDIKNKVAGDFAGFDRLPDSDMLEEVGNKLISLFSDVENNIIRRAIWREVCNPRVVFGKDIVELTRGLMSGFFLTTFVNCINNLTYMKYAWIDVHGGDISSLRTFNDFVLFIVFGDDGIGAISPLKVDIYNQVSITASLEKLGIVYTAETKDGSEPELRYLSEINFLKRGFQYDSALCRWVAPLSLDTIVEMPYWTKRDNPGMITEGNLDNALRELALHERSVFDSYAPRMIRAARDRMGYSPQIIEYEVLRQEALNSEYIF